MPSPVEIFAQAKSQMRSSAKKNPGFQHGEGSVRLQLDLCACVCGCVVHVRMRVRVCLCACGCASDSCGEYFSWSLCLSIHGGYQPSPLLCFDLSFVMTCPDEHSIVALES